jgi:hypothetical protein
MQRSAVMMMVFVGAVVVCLFFSLPAAAEQRTLTGIINDSDQLVSSSGEVYEIADTEAGVQLLEEAADDPVSVNGDVVEDEEINFITVESFKILTPSSELEGEETAKDPSSHTEENANE